jgi:hypothetical protein
MSIAKAKDDSDIGKEATDAMMVDRRGRSIDVKGFSKYLNVKLDRMMASKQSQ